MQRCLRARVEIGIAESHRGNYTADADDPGSWSGQVRLGRLEQQEDAADIGVESNIEVFNGEVFETGIPCHDGSVVDNDVNSLAWESL